MALCDNIGLVSLIIRGSMLSLSCLFSFLHHPYILLFYLLVIVVVASFTEKLQELLGDSYGDFDLLTNVEKTSYVLVSEHWEKNFKSLLFLVKEYVVDVWEVRKQILYGDDACPSHLQSQSTVGVSLELIGIGVVSWTNEVSLSM